MFLSSFRLWISRVLSLYLNKYVLLNITGRGKMALPCAIAPSSKTCSLWIFSFLFNYFKSSNFLFCLKIKLHRVEKVKNKKQTFGLTHMANELKILIHKKLSHNVITIKKYFRNSFTWYLSLPTRCRVSDRSHTAFPL